MSLEIVPVTFRQACAFVAEHHRHHKPPRGMKFCLAVAADGVIVGVTIAGRPVARAFDDGRTLEVNRTCTDGTHNANSMMYAAAWKVAQGLGYHRLVTYTQDGESGASLRGAGWRIVAQRSPRPGWAESSVVLRDMRDPVGSGGVARTLWQAQ